ncbi:MAG: MarR family transcriptional regulator [Saprospiraceae bacterium]|nr:MarR family transcriptional regulator [Saprospiraceae bacterium]
MNATFATEVRGYLIERTAKRLKRAFQQTLAEMDADITADQWVVLDVVMREEGLSQQEIGQATAKDRPTVTRILDKLERKGLLKRTTDPEDRRKFGIFSTPAGRRKVRTLLPRIEAFRLTHFDGLSNQDMRDLMRILDKINANISSSESTNHALS